MFIALPIGKQTLIVGNSDGIGLLKVCDRDSVNGRGFDLEFAKNCAAGIRLRGIPLLNHTHGYITVHRAKRKGEPKTPVARGNRATGRRDLLFYHLGCDN